MKSHETAFHVINCHVPVCHAVVPSRKWTMWLFRYVIVMSYKCSVMSTEVAPQKLMYRLDEFSLVRCLRFLQQNNVENYTSKWFTLWSTRSWIWKNLSMLGHWDLPSVSFYCNWVWTMSNIVLALWTQALAELAEYQSGCFSYPC